MQPPICETLVLKLCRSALQSAIREALIADDRSRSTDRALESVAAGGGSGERLRRFCRTVNLAAFYS